MPRNKLILLLGDVLIPILGFFFWNWNLYFIFLFMFLDLLSYFVLYPFKYKKICNFRNQPIQQQKLLGQLVLFACIITLIFIGYTFLLNTIQQATFRQEIIRFFFYKDMGFSQGYILIPLIILTAWSTYKSEFLILGGFSRISLNKLLKSYLINTLSAGVLLVIFWILFLFNISSTAIYFYTGILLFSAFKLLSILKPEFD